MEGTAIVGAEEAEPFEAVAEAGCKFLKDFEDIWHLGANYISAINDAEACAEVKASTNTFAVYSSHMPHPDWRIGQFAGDAYKNGKNCINFPSSVVATARSAWDVGRDFPGEKDDEEELM